MRKVYIIGTGQTKRGFFPDKDWRRLIFEAASQAVEDAGVDVKNIEHIWLGHYPATADLHFTANHPTVDVLGLSTLCGCTVVEKACTSSGDALHGAFLSVASGMCDIVLALAVGKTADSFGGGFSSLAESNVLLAHMGILDGLDRAREGGGEEYLRRYVTEDDVYALYETWYWYATRNPISIVYQGSYKTRDEWNALPYDAFPFRVGTAGCRFADGASAVILASEEVARAHTDTPVEILASVVRDDAMFHTHRIQYHPWTSGLVPNVQTAWKAAYEMAKVEPTKFDVFQPHENSPMKAWKHMEMFGHPDIPIGKGPKWYTEGQALPGGKLPSITSGMCKGGYNMAAVAMDQVIENVLQLTMRSGRRQAPMKNYLAASIDSSIRVYISILGR